MTVIGWGEIVNENAVQYWERVKQYWNKFTKAQKIYIVGTFVLTALALGIVTYQFSKTEYALAFTELQPNDAAAIKQYLDSAKIPYQISADGKSIEVPREKVANVKVDVVGQGLNKNGSVGYEAFRESKPFGMTENEFRIKQLDAVQGELQRLINTNTAISSSKVLITMPEKSVFVREKAEQATASVAVTVKSGYSLDQQKVDTMYQLVSKSVPNLPIENITISDQNGDPLLYSKAAGGTQVNAGNAATQQFQIKKQFEQDITKQVKEILGTVLGPKKVIPMVVATLNFDKRTKTSQIAQPVVGEKGIEISKQTQSKTSNSDGSTQGGVVGTGGTDVPNYPGTSNNGAKVNSEENSETVNYEITRITENVEASPFFVNDLTISVGIDRDDTVTQETKDAIQKVLESVVKASLANNGRVLTAEELGSRVTVFDHSFAADPTAAQANGVNWYLWGGIGALVAALAAGGGFMIASRRRKKAEQAIEEAEEVQAPTKVEFPTIDLDNVTNENQARKQLELLAKKKPEEFVNLLRTWLVDE